LRTDFTISTGEKVRTDLLSLHIGRESKFKSISPGISPLELVPREIGLKTLGLDENETRPIVVWNARMVDVKSPESVLDLAKMFPETLFVMSGGGKRFDFIKNSNKFSNLKVVGWQDPEVINSVADVAISTSRNEGIPISLIESQLSGIPVVAMRVGSIEEIIENGKTGFVCDYFVGDFTESLKKLIESQSLRVQMGVQAKINAQDKFSKIKLALEHVSVFESLEVNPRGIS
jgi:glycosyltransferase involved in cell wall biosynthesis